MMEKNLQITVIESQNRRFGLGWKEVWQYRDLVLIFIRRDIVSTYKQTILGPLWFIISPILTTLIFSFVFGEIAGIGTQGMPKSIFYLSGLSIWNYFSGCFTGTSSTFVNNAQIFGKVYFPRLAVPLSLVISNLVKFFIQMIVLIAVVAYHVYRGTFVWSPGPEVLLFPIVVITMALLGLGSGILVSSLTTKYRDIAILVSFGIGLLMYVTPVIYPMEALPGKARWIVALNPISPLVEIFRTSFLGVGSVDWNGLFYSMGCTVVLLVLGSIFFNKVERSFMDTV